MPNQFGEITDRGISLAAQRRLGVEPGLSQSLSPELALQMALPADELQYHMGWRRYWVMTTQAAVAANAGILRVRCPAGSNFILRLESIIVSATVALEVGASIGNGLPNLTTVVGGASGSGLARDTRQFGPNNLIGGQGVVSKDAIAAQVPTVFDAFVAANTPIDVLTQAGPIFLMDANGAGSTAVNAFIQQLNQAVTFVAIWSERMLNESETAL